MAGAAGFTSIFDNLSAITRDTYLPGLVDNIYDSNPLLKRLRMKADFQSGGEGIREQLLYAKNTAKGSYTGFDILSTAPTEKFASAILPWAHYYVNITISHTDMLKNNNDAQIISLLEAELASAELDMGDILGDGLFDDGSDGTGIVGLRELTGTNRTYAGIDSTTRTFWDSQEVTTTLSLANLADSTNSAYIITQFRDMWSNCGIGKDNPTLILVTQEVWNVLWSELYGKTTYFVGSNRADSPHADLANAGFQVLDFMGAPVVVDSHCPNGFAFFLNEKYLKLIVHTEDDFNFEPFQQPVNQQVNIAKLLWTGQMITSNARMQGVFTDIGAS